MEYIWDCLIKKLYIYEDYCWVYFDCFLWDHWWLFDFFIYLRLTVNLLDSLWQTHSTTQKHLRSYKKSTQTYFVNLNKNWIYYYLKFVSWRKENKLPTNLILFTLKTWRNVVIYLIVFNATVSELSNKINDLEMSYQFAIQFLEFFCWKMKGR